MNENIKEIAKQCNFTELNIEDLSPGLNDFAISLIGKCLEFIEPIQESDNEQKLQAQESIKKYFGIGENTPRLKP